MGTHYPNNLLEILAEFGVLIKNATLTPFPKQYLCSVSAILSTPCLLHHMMMSWM